MVVRTLNIAHCLVVRRHFWLEATKAQVSPRDNDAELSATLGRALSHLCHYVCPVVSMSDRPCSFLYTLCMVKNHSRWVAGLYLVT